MRRRSAFIIFALVASTLAAIPLAQAADPPAPRDAPDGRYAMAGGCYAVQSAATGQFVSRGGPGFELGAGSVANAEPFHFQATDLGMYLLFGSQRDFFGGPASADKASEFVDFQIEGSPGAFAMTVPKTGQAVVASPVPGQLALAPAVVAQDPARQFSFVPASGCAEWPEIATNVTTGTTNQTPRTKGKPDQPGKPDKGSKKKGPKAPSTDEVRGLLEAHMHLMAFEFLGGEARCGRPWHPYGVEHALVDCEDHEPGGHGAVLEMAISGQQAGEGHDTVGWPTFRDWPAHDSLTHEGSYYKWLERAWQSGLRFYVNLLVDNTALCQAYPIKRNSCNEMDGVRLQAQRLHELQDYIDAQHGGPGEGWFRIVRDPFEARKVINQGKLAVLMGIEVSVLFDCGEYLDQPLCTADDIDQRLDEVYDMGIRQMELVNKFDNALSGVAGDSGQTGVIVNTGNRHVTGHWWDMQTCQEPDGHADHAHDRTQINYRDETPDDPGYPGFAERDALAGGVLALSGMTRGYVAPIYPEGDHCNTRGLTPLGEHLIRKMVEKGMIFDPDHMSVAGQRAAFEILEELGYPGVISSHGWSAGEVEARIYRLGGLVTPYAGGSEGFAGKWARTRAKYDALVAGGHIPEGHYFGFGYGADMNGFGGQGGPRASAAHTPLTYPFPGILDDGTVVHQQVSGERVYDFNVDGTAHYGLYADWMRDALIVAGGGDVNAPAALRMKDDMVRGAEAYLRMWEGANGVKPNPCVTAQDMASHEDLHALLGADAATVLVTLGQPSRRQGGAFVYCDQGPVPTVIRFDARGHVAQIG